jgi:hypothetical protein
MGKGLTNIRSPQRKHYPDCRIGGNNANLSAGNSKKNTEASIFEEPGEVVPHAGVLAKVSVEIRNKCSKMYCENTIYTI